LSALRELSLDRGRITDQGLASLRGLGALESLDLSSTLVDDSGVAVLAQFPRLRHLVLGGLVTDGCAPSLRALKNLEDIDISQTTIGEKGLAALAALPKLKTLFMGKQASDRGLALLSKSRSLRTLDLSRSGVSDAGVKNLSAVKTLEEIALGQTAIGNDSLASLAELPELRILDLSETQVTSAGLPPLARLKKLTVLSLSWQTLTREDLRAMAQLRQLKTIVLNGVPLPGTTMAQLKHLGHPSPWEPVKGFARAELAQAKGLDPKALAAPVSVPGPNVNVSALPKRAASGAAPPAAPELSQRAHPAADAPALPIPERVVRTSSPGADLSAPAAKPNPIAGGPARPSGREAEENLLKVIALASNPAHAGAFSGLSGMRQLSQTETVAFLDRVSSDRAKPAIPVEEDRPENSLGEISVGVRSSR
jgi:hypothetical protein